METMMAAFRRNPGSIVIRWLERARIQEPEPGKPAGEKGYEDRYAYAEGEVCEKCGGTIETAQRARRRGETGWVHDMCPVSPGNAGFRV
jgi:hypothetical protein